MADPRFFDNRGPFTLKELADRIGARLGPGCEAGLLLHDVAPIESAGPGMLTYLDRGKDPAALEGMMAAACLVPPNAAIADRTGTAWLIADLPRRAFALASQSFYPRQAASGRVTAGAVIDPSARIGIGVEIGANAVVEAGAEIGDRTLLGPGAVVGRNVTIGRDCVIGPVVSLSHCHVGDRVTLHAGVRIGEDGFGVVPGAKHTKVPQLGRAIIQDDVEIGANSCVDRGTAGDTVIGEGTCIDNLVQIGHNVRIGRYCVLAALIGISGSVTIGDYVAIGGQSGFKDHITVGDGAEIGAQSGVMRDVQPGERIVGSPAQPVKRFFRMIAILARMTDHAGKNG